MKLYYAPGACSLSPHIVLREAGIPFKTEKVDLKAHRTEGGADYYAINPKGYVPALELDDGSVLTEGPAITQYVADRKPETNLAPPCGSLGRARLQEWLHFIGTELHKSYSPLFSPTTSDEVRKGNLEKIGKRFELVSRQLHDRPYLLGSAFTLPDAYLFVMLTWSKKFGPSVLSTPVMREYFERLAARPAVKAALEHEGLKL